MAPRPNLNGRTPHNPLAARLAEVNEWMDSDREPQPEKEYVEVPALALAEDGTIPAKNFTITPVGLKMGTDATEEDWVSVGDAIFRFEGAVQWIIGDWLNFGFDKFGYTVDYLAALLNRDPKTLKNWASVAKGFSQSLRKEKLYFGHYNLIAGRTADKEELINLAVEHDWSVRELHEEIKRRNRKRPRRPLKEQVVKQARRSLDRFVESYKQIDLDARSEIAQYLRELADKLER